MDWFTQWLDRDGFLGTRGSLLLDLVVTGMLVFVLVLCASIWLVKFRRRFRLHKCIQIALGLLLLVTVVVFEIEVRISGWTHRARRSPFWVEGAWNDWIDYSLGIHLLFAIPTPILWIIVIAGALRHFPSPPRPGRYSRIHIPWARCAAAGMILTALTGWIFYWVAFVATG